MAGLVDDNAKLVEQFNAKHMSTVHNAPDFYTFKRGLMYSHRDFDLFMKRLESGEQSAIVTGVNASGTLHLAHKPVFDTAIYFQKMHDVKVIIPISDDESYVSKKAENQEIALRNALALTKDLLAIGLDPKKTYVVIDQIYTNIYNLAIKASRHMTMSEIKAIYGYKNEENIGLHFYPAVQSAHVMLPEEIFGIKNTLVPIGPDEDTHLRAARDIAARMGYAKPAVIHVRFLPGLDAEKMSKSRNNSIFFHDDPKAAAKKIMGAFSGGRATVEEHRKFGGDPDVDVSYTFLKYFYLNEKEAKKIHASYKSGEMLSGEMKAMLKDKVVEELMEFQKRLLAIKKSDVEKVLLKNPEPKI